VMHPKVLIVLRRLIMVVSALVSIIIGLAQVFLLLHLPSYRITSCTLSSVPVDVGVQLLDAIQVA